MTETHNAGFLRHLTLADWELVERLKAAEGWNQTLADYRNYVEHEPQGCFLAQRDGSPAGVISTTTYRQELAWIGMMLVDIDFRRQGIARSLMRHALDYLDGRGIKCVKLDASAAGAPLYRQLGFADEMIVQRWERDGDNEPVKINHVEPTPELLQLDLDLFGADRSDWLNRLASISFCDVQHDDSGCCGFGMLRSGARATTLGPIMASDPSVGESIARSLAGRHEGRMFWDILKGNEAAQQVAGELGFVPVRTLERMWIGADLIRPDERKQWAIADLATG